MYIGSADGTLAMMNTFGETKDLYMFQSRIDAILLHEEKKRIIVLTRSFHLVQLEQNADGTVKEASKMKVSVYGDVFKKGISKISWIAPGVIASATRENFIRFWDLNTDESYVLSLESANIPSSDRVTDIIFHPIQRKLVAGTFEGRCVFWKWVYINNERVDKKDGILSSKIQWESCDVFSVTCEDPIISIKWGFHNNLLVESHSSANTAFETIPSGFICNEIIAILVKRNAIRIQNMCNNETFVVRTNINVKEFVVDSNHLVVWNREEICVYKLEHDSGFEISNFPFTATSVALFQNSLYIAQERQLIITNLEGVEKLAVPFSVDEGKLIHLDIRKNFLAVSTINGYFKLFDIAKKDPQSLQNKPGKFIDAETGNRLGSIKSIKCNSIGTKISILTETVTYSHEFCETETKLYVYDRILDAIDSIDFGQNNRFPTDHYWDLNEPNLLSCETCTFENNLPSEFSDDSRSRVSVS